MNCSINIDWKFMTALGLSTVGIIFAAKMNESAVENVSMSIVDAFKEYVIAEDSNH